MAIFSSGSMLYIYFFILFFLFFFLGGGGVIEPSPVDTQFENTIWYKILVQSFTIKETPYPNKPKWSTFRMKSGFVILVGC